MSTGYAEEKLSVAADILASSKGRINERLYYAALEFHPLQASDFPNDWGQEYLQMYEAINRMPARTEGEGTLKSTLDQITEDEAVEHVKTLLSLCYRIEQYNQEHEQE